MLWIALILPLPYLFILLLIFRHLRKINPVSLTGNPSTPVSVIVACRNEEGNLPNLLACLRDQDYPPDLFSVIIVDDNSTDRTASVASTFSGSMKLTILRNEGSGKKEALRTGISKAPAELIVTTDADCTMGRCWLRVIVRYYEMHKAGLIIAPVMLSQKKGFFGRFQELEFLSLQGITAATAASGTATMCNGANLAFTKTAYHENIGNLRFDIATGDDVFLLHSMKWNKNKISLLFLEAAMVITSPAKDISAFLKQRKRWASKATAYRDRFSIILGIVTFVTNLVQAALFTGLFFDLNLLMPFLLCFLLKSIPDYLILHYTTKRYGRNQLMWWFLPSQIVYPFYVVVVAGFALISSKQ
jgi:cellulose synthase/poly-beta-1,6-N-acetylglucosamine synthase-like glycosyltransferase